MLNNIAGLYSPTGSAVVGDYDSIQTVTVGAGGTATISFTSIPSTYSHLQIRVLHKPSTSASWFQMKFNSDSTSTNYTQHWLYGNGATTIVNNGLAAGNFAFGGLYLATVTANVFAAGIVDILDYANTSKNKTMRTLNGSDANGSGNVGITSAAWLSTSAINRIDIITNTGQNFDQYSSFALYGIN